MHPPVELPQGGAQLVLDDVEKTYPGTVPVRALKPITISVERGEMLAIVGRSGSGKSTLLNILGLLDAPTSGTYRVEGINTRELTEPQKTALRASYFGFVFQQYFLLPDRTVSENAEMALLHRRYHRRERSLVAQASLERVGMLHRRRAMPATLSGGERQRTAIARALAQQPQVLLCDEPTGNLDAENSDHIIGLLRALNTDGFTVVIVTHDLDIARSVPRCVVVDDGVASESSGQASLSSSVANMPGANGRDGIVER